MKKAIVFWLFLLLVAGPALTAQAQTSSEPEAYEAESQVSPSGGAMFGDAVVVRPFSLLLTALGVVGTAVTLPFSIPSGSVKAMSDKLIAKPFAFTFTRPLGVFPVDTVPWN